MKEPRSLLLPSLLLAACGSAGIPGDEAGRDASPAASAPTAQMTPTGAASPAAAVATLTGKSGSEVSGELEFAARDGGVSLQGEIAGLTPGTEHGFHVHETGDCSAEDAKSAGAHFNPGNAPHGPPTATAAERHLGDLPNVMADEQGHATIQGALQDATLRDGGPNDLIGKAVIVHAKRDDYVTQPSGDSGDRIACGVIR